MGFKKEIAMIMITIKINNKLYYSISRNGEPSLRLWNDKARVTLYERFLGFYIIKYRFIIRI